MSKHSWPLGMTALVRAVGVLVIIVQSLDLGCSARCAGSLVESEVRSKQIRRFVFRQSPDKLYRIMRQALARQGYRLPDTTDVVGKLHVSEWNEEAFGSMADMNAKAVWIWRAGGGTRMEIYELTLRGTEQGEKAREQERDETAEWELIQQLEPSRASAIEQMAAKRRQEVENRLVGCGCVETWGCGRYLGEGCSCQECRPACQRCDSDCSLTGPLRPRAVL